MKASLRSAMQAAALAALTTAAHGTNAWAQVASKFGETEILAGAATTMMTSFAELPHGGVSGPGGKSRKFILGVEIGELQHEKIAVEFEATRSRSLEVVVRAPFRLSLKEPLPAPPSIETLQANYNPHFQIWTSIKPEEYRPVLVARQTRPTDPDWTQKLNWSADYPQLDELNKQIDARIGAVRYEHRPIFPDSCAIDIAAAPRPQNKLSNSYLKVLKDSRPAQAILLIDNDARALSGIGTASPYLASEIAAGETAKVPMLRQHLLQDLGSLRAEYLNRECRRYLYHASILPRSRVFILSELDQRELALLEQAWLAAVATGPLELEEMFFPTPAGAPGPAGAYPDNPDRLLRAISIMRNPQAGVPPAAPAGKLVDPRIFQILQGATRDIQKEHGAWVFKTLFSADLRPDYETDQAGSMRIKYNAEYLIDTFFKQVRAKVDYERPLSTAAFLAEQIQHINANVRRASVSRQFAPEPWNASFIPRYAYKHIVADYLGITGYHDWDLKLEPSEVRVDREAARFEDYWVAVYHGAIELLLLRLESERIRFLLAGEVIELVNAQKAVKELAERAQEVVFGVEPFRLLDVKIRPGMVAEQGDELAVVHPVLKDALLVKIPNNDPLLAALRPGAKVALKVMSEVSLPIPSLLTATAKVTTDTSKVLKTIGASWRRKLEFDGVITALAQGEAHALVEVVVEAIPEHYVVSRTRQYDLSYAVTEHLDKILTTTTIETAGGETTIVRRLPDALFPSRPFRILLIPAEVHDQNTYRDLVVALE